MADADVDGLLDRLYPNRAGYIYNMRLDQLPVGGQILGLAAADQARVVSAALGGSP